MTTVKTDLDAVAGVMVPFVPRSAVPRANVQAAIEYLQAVAAAKLDFITVTQAVDLDAIESRVNDLDAAVVLKGAWDASAGTFPGAGVAQAGWSYIVSVAGTVGGVAFVVGDRIVCILDNASTTTYASNWLKLDYTDQVSSVAGRTGAVALTSADLTDTTAFARTLLDDSTASEARATLAVREILTADRTYYVRTDGSDTNTGLANTAGGAFLTPQKAIDTVAQIDMAGFTSYIQLPNTTYTGALTLKSLVGGSCVIIGDETTPSNVLFSVTGNTVFTANATTGVWHIRGVKMQTTTFGNCFTVNTNAALSFQNVDFGAAANFHMHVYSGAMVTATGPFTISGGASYHALLQAASVYNYFGQAVTLSGTPAFTAFVAVQQAGVLVAGGASYSGSATGARYDITSGGIIDVAGGGTSALPGNAAGSGGTASGGGFYA